MHEFIVDNYWPVVIMSFLALLILVAIAVEEVEIPTMDDHRAIKYFDMNVVWLYIGIAYLAIFLFFLADMHFDTDLVSTHTWLLWSIAFIPPTGWLIYRNVPRSDPDENDTRMYKLSILFTLLNSLPTIVGLITLGFWFF